MHVYQSLNFAEVKDGRLYTLNVPQLNQDMSEVYEVLEAFKKQILALEEISKKPVPESLQEQEPSVAK